MQLFSEGKDSSWGHIYYKMEYETVRDKTKLGIRWKITWAIDRYYYFGYNIAADVWTEGQNFGRQLKGNSPNRGSGVSYFPSENDYLWFDEGYASNEINGCRIIMKSTNGGTIPFNTGADRTLTTDVGYIASTLNSVADFDIGSNIPILITDVTNQIYNYKLYLDIYNESNTWQNVKQLDTTSKNFTLDLSALTTTLYNLLPNSKNRSCRIRLETYIGITLLGTNTTNGTCSVINSNPTVPNFKIFDISGIETTGIVAGFGPYNDNSNVVLATEDNTIVSKNGATLKKIIIEWNGIIGEVIL